MQQPIHRDLLRPPKTRTPVRPRWQRILDSAQQWMPAPTVIKESTSLLVHRGIVRAGSSRDFEYILRMLADSTDSGLAVFQGYALNHNTIITNNNPDGTVASVCTTWVVEWANGDTHWHCRLDAEVKHDTVPVFDRKAWAFTLDPTGRADVMLFSVTVTGEKVKLAALYCTVGQVAWSKKQRGEELAARVDKYLPMRYRDTFWKQAESKIFTHTDSATMRVGDLWLFVDITIHRNTLRGCDALNENEHVSVRLDRSVGLVVNAPPDGLYFNYGVELRVAGAVGVCVAKV